MHQKNLSAGNPLYVDEIHNLYFRVGLFGRLLKFIYLHTLLDRPRKCTRFSTKR